MTKKEANRQAVMRYRKRHAPRYLASARKGATKRYAARRALLNWLKQVPCVDCGVTFPPCVMDFDHRPSEKKTFCVAINWMRSLSTIIAEIRKCDVVCANCHRIRTANRRIANGM